MVTPWMWSSASSTCDTIVPPAGGNSNPVSFNARPGAARAVRQSEAQRDHEELQEITAYPDAALSIEALS